VSLTRHQRLDDVRAHGPTLAGVGANLRAEDRDAAVP
jgi:hypothetical protein